MSKDIFVRSALNFDVEENSLQNGIGFDPEESVVQQQFAAEADINEIVRRFGLTGELPNGINMPVSGDFTEVTDFQTAMNMIRQAQESFLLLPADIRERFSNDPARVIAFLDDPNNRDEAIKLGIVAKPIERPRDVVAAVDELAAQLRKT